MEIHKTQFTSICHRKTSPSNQKSLKNSNTQILKPFKTLNNPSNLLLYSNSHPNPPLKPIKKPTHFVENYYVTPDFHSLTQKLKKGNLSPLQLLHDNGDWSKTQFWFVIKFLHESSRFNEIVEVFNAWTKLQESRINELNYDRIIRLLSEAGMMDQATLVLQNMKNYGIHLSSEVYNYVIHGYAQEGKFDDALLYLNEMEKTNFSPDTETYDGLIKGYGKFQMYDEMVKCLKKMANAGCSPDHVTYNLLIRELSKARLLNRMERMYHTLISKRLDLQSLTLVAMLEAYADFGLLEKMEWFYMKVRKSKIILKERTVRKIARVYLENHMYSILDDLANDVEFRIGRTNLFWCLRLLCHGCQLSKKGMHAVINEMEEERVPWNVTFVNIISFAYLKMKDFKLLDTTFSELPHRHVNPDLVTFGVLFDGNKVGFGWSRTLKIWRKYGYFEDAVVLNTDSLISSAFGKGLFLRTVEEIASLLEPKMREEQLWTYETLFDFVLKHQGSSSSLANNSGSDFT